MKINKKFSVLLFLALNLLAVYTFALPLANMHTEDNLKFTVNKDHPEFVIRLKSNPTTGFTWTLKDYDKSLVVNTKHEFLPAKTGLIGAGGFDQWSFRVKPEAFVLGQPMKLRFVYARSWEKSGQSSEVEFEVSFS